MFLVCMCVFVVCVCVFLVCFLVLLVYGYVLLIWRNSTWKSTLWLLFKWYSFLLPWKTWLLFFFFFFALPPLTSSSFFFFSIPASSPLLLFSFFFFAFFFSFSSVQAEMHMVWHIFTTVQTQARALTDCVHGPALCDWWGLCRHRHQRWLTVCTGLHCVTDEDCAVSFPQQQRRQRQRALAKCHLRGGNSVVCQNTWIKNII